MTPIPLPLCPTCQGELRFSRTIFSDNTEVWRCDPCDQEVTLPAPDDPPTLVVDPPFRDEFIRRVEAQRQGRQGSDLRDYLLSVGDEEESQP